MMILEEFVRLGSVERLGSLVRFESWVVLEFGKFLPVFEVYFSSLLIKAFWNCF